MQHGISFAQQAVDRGGIVNSDRMISVSCSTISFFRNQDQLHLVNTCTPDNKIRVHTNGGYLDYYQVVTLKYLALYVFIKRS